MTTHAPTEKPTAPDGSGVPTPPVASSIHFADRLDAAIRAKSGGEGGGGACVGLDPVVERIPGAVRGSDPVEAITNFSRHVLEAVAPHAAIVKFQSACFERYGGAGVRALRRLVDQARSLDLLTILDAKRGDIGITADHYAAAAFGEPAPDGAHEILHAEGGADAITLSPYLGMETIAPFIRPGRGVFVLVRTSNPGGDEIQTAPLADGRNIAEMIADHVADFGAPHLGECGLSSVGAVVRATKAAEGEALRARMPDQIFLIPGYGAQGGTLEDVRRLVRPAAARNGPGGASAGVIVAASRSIIYAFERGEEKWQAKVADAARRLTDELATLAD
jgi:orotidine-5'-phosphate decarboxylase